MSKTSWVCSDHHLGHENVWKTFKKGDGSPLRPFSSTEEMNETIIERHNAIVKPQDHVYFLGDVVINKKFLPLIKRMNGHKRLIMGNHDIHSNKLYYEAGFEKLAGCRVFVDRFILTHIPIHQSSVTNRFKVNVTGHLHANYVNDPRFLTVCMEHTNFTPLSFEEVDERVKMNRESFAQTGNVINWGGGVAV